MTQKPETPTAVANAAEVPSVLSEGHPQGDASGNETLRDRITAVNPLASQKLVDGVVSEVKAMHEAFVTIPQIGAYRTADHRYYWNGKGPLPSVTSILSVLDKPAVVQWAKREVSQMAAATAETGGLTQVIDLIGREEAALWMSRLPDYVKDEAGKLGSGVHLLADMASRGSVTGSEAFQVSDLERPYLEAFQGFLDHLRVQRAEIVSSEKMVWSTDGYAGTYDLIVRFYQCGQSHTHDVDCPKELWLLDIKTSKGYYPETALQLVAYGYADQIILEGNPDGYPMPIVNRYGVLHLRPDVYPDTGWRLIEYPVQDSDYVAFLGALELYRWKQEGRYTKSKLQNHKPPKGPLDSPTATQDQTGAEN